MEKLGRYIVFIISGLFFSILFYASSVDAVLPKIKYENNIRFDLAFINYNDVLNILFKSRDSSDSETYRIDVYKSDVMQHYEFSIPFEYEPILEIIFGESNPVSFAISNIAVNGQLVNNELVIRELNKIGYSTVYHGNVIYAEPKVGNCHVTIHSPYRA